MIVYESKRAKKGLRDNPVLALARNLPASPNLTSTRPDLRTSK